MVRSQGTGANAAGIWVFLLTFLLGALGPAFSASAEPEEAQAARQLALLLPAEDAQPGARPATPGPWGEDELDALSAELDESIAQDPFESVNRYVFSFNEGVDFVLLDPVTRAYSFLLPDGVKSSVRNVFANLNTPVVLVNHLLQLEPRNAFVTTARFLVNSTMGMAGLFDAASTMGLEPHETGFSDTLAVAGVGRGPYLVVPFLGPSTVRDGFGNIVDLAMAPQSYLLPVVGSVLLTGSNGIILREEHFDGLQALRDSSVDYYSSLRSAYLESR